MDNKYSGMVGVRIGDKDYSLFYNWEALAKIKSTYGSSIIRDLYSAEEPAKLADVVSIGLSHKHPEMTPELIIKLSPPIMPLIMAVDKAMAYAYFGNELPDVPEEDKKKLSLKNLFKRTK